MRTARRKPHPPCRLRPPVLPAALAAAGLALAVAALGPAFGQDEDQGRIIIRPGKSARQETAGAAPRARDLQAEETEVRRRYEDIVQAIGLSQDVLGRMSQRERDLTEQSGQLAEDLSGSQQLHAARVRALGRSLRAMYLHDLNGDLQRILTADSFSGLVARLRMQRMLARLQADLVQRTRTQAEYIQVGRKQLDTALAEIWRTREQMNEESGRLQLLMAEQTAALRDLKAAKEDAADRLLKRDADARKLDGILENIERRRQGAPDSGSPAASALAADAGRLPWPAQGEPLRAFGSAVDPDLGLATINNGLDIGAPAGAPVAAVAEGTVEYCAGLPGFGRCVILAHGQGYATVYAHVERILVAAGERVAVGQVIAEVGRPAPGATPSLHFEIRQGRTPLDPEDWLLPR